jgi:hypothetical protein
LVQALSSKVIWHTTKIAKHDKIYFAHTCKWKIRLVLSYAIYRKFSQNCVI